MLTQKMRNLKQIWIWLRRFRYRCGYGVHSPFAFNFITNVIYEKSAYYAYEEIERAGAERVGLNEKKIRPSKKTNRLLFRLVNSVQPQTIIDGGRPGKTSYYLQAAKRTAAYIPLFAKDINALSDTVQVDFLFINRPEDLLFVDRLFEYGVSRVTPHSMIVIHGINSSAAMKTFWNRAITDERVGITFDLYDVGILFFDHSKIKQHYIVNF